MSRSSFALKYQVNPIILTGGLASQIVGGMLPLISITESANFRTGLLSGGGPTNIEDYFAAFTPLPDSTLIDQDIGTYPFANQATAANAVITKGLNISMRMDCPVREASGYQNKLNIITALVSALAQHNSLGGTYSIATLSYIYTNCVMLRMSDISGGESKQSQISYRLDFFKPLLTLDQLTQVQNSLMSRLSNQTAINGDVTWTGLEPNVGLPASSTAPSIVPASQGSPAAGAAPSTSSLNSLNTN